MTVFKNLYIFNHTIYIVTTDPRSVPERRWILSKGKVLNPKEPNEPDEQTLAIISPIEAKLLFGSFASVMGGVSVSSIIILSFLARLTHGALVHTNRQPAILGPHVSFCRRYVISFSCPIHILDAFIEIFALWHWRGYTSPELDSWFGGASRPLPSRWIFPNSPRAGFLDRAGMNLWTLRAAVPSISLEFSDDWEHRMNQSRPFVLEYVVLGDRATWHRVPSWKPPGVVFPVEVREDFWKPVRELVTEFATQPIETTEPRRPVITYISRQQTGRRLKDKHHEQLVAALEEFARTEDYEVNEFFFSV